MKTYCKKNNSHCIPKAPKHDPFHRSFPPLYLGSGQRLVPMYAGCAADQLCLPFKQEKLAETCVCCGKPATKMVYWGKAY